MSRVEFGQYLDIPYNFDNYPGVVREDSDAINCISLIHRILRQEFWVNLPTGMWAREILQDESLLLRTVTDDKRVIGDIFVFGKKDPGNDPVFHLAMHTGQADETGDPLLIHTTDLNGRKSTIWPMGRFLKHPSSRYEKLYAVKRVEPVIWQTAIAPFVNA